MCKGEYQPLIILNRMTHSIINLLSESYVYKKKKSLGSGVRTFLVKMFLARNAVDIILNLFMNSGIPSLSNFEFQKQISVSEAYLKEVVAVSFHPTAD